MFTGPHSFGNGIERRDFPSECFLELGGRHNTARIREDKRLAKMKIAGTNPKVLSCFPIQIVTPHHHRGTCRKMLALPTRSNPDLVPGKPDILRPNPRVPLLPGKKRP